MKPYDAENRVEEILEIFIRDGVIRQFMRARKNGTYDEDGIDFLIFFHETCLCLPLQVKQNEKSITRHRKNHPHIRHVIVAREEEEINEIKERLIRIINVALRPSR